MSRWSKRFDVKVVPRRYLHLYRCFGWTPTSPMAVPQYDWERKGPNSAAAYTSADISANLQEYDDLGMKRKEFVAVKRNTKFLQYKKQYPVFFKNEKQFLKLMNRYTVGKNTKITGLKQMYYISKKVIDIILAIVCLALVAAVSIPFVNDYFHDFICDKAFGADSTTGIGIVFYVLSAFFVILSFREVSFGRAHSYTLASGEDDDFILRQHRFMKIKTSHTYLMLLPAVACLIMGLVSMSVIKSLPFVEEGFFTLKRLYAFLVLALYLYGCFGLTIHGNAAVSFNPYAWIKMLCLQARPVTKRILMSDISMMSPQQRQRYQQGRIISSAVSDALDKRSHGIKEDFYIGY